MTHIICVIHTLKWLIVYDVFPEWTDLDSGIINIKLTLPVTKSVILSKLSSSSGNLKFIGGHN